MGAAVQVSFVSGKPLGVAFAILGDDGNPRGPALLGSMLGLGEPQSMALE